MTMERVACCAKPCATCCACSDCCLDGMALHAGPAGPAAGRIADRSRLIGAAAQPRGGGGLRPQMQIMDRTVDGTCECVGGAGGPGLAEKRAGTDWRAPAGQVRQGPGPAVLRRLLGAVLRQPIRGRAVLRPPARGRPVPPRGRRHHPAEAGLLRRLRAGALHRRACRLALVCRVPAATLLLTHMAPGGRVYDRPHRQELHPAAEGGRAGDDGAGEGARGGRREVGNARS